MSSSQSEEAALPSNMSLHELAMQAQIVLPCQDLAPNLDFFVNKLGFRVRMITPADNPALAIVHGHGIELCLDAIAPFAESAAQTPQTIRLATERSHMRDDLVAPNGTRITFVDADPPLVMPGLVEAFALSRRADADWVTGRAGMQYRDLIPSRLGGRFIASNIRIQTGGTVDDYPHFHKIRFQMIFCVEGWVRVAYEDQGEPLLIEAGDCFLQPPEIRHQVLESSPGLEVIEIGSPAEHETFGDLEIQLPTETFRPDRDFGGQRFVHHIAASANWHPFAQEGPTGLQYRDVGINKATGGLAEVGVIRPVENAEQAALGLPASSHDGEFLLFYVLAGSAQLHCRGQHLVVPGDSVTIPANDLYGLSECSVDLAVLRVALP